MATGAGWIWLSVLYVLLGMLSLAPVIMLPMMFDAPGSEENTKLIVAALTLALFPVFCFLGAALPWMFRKKAFARKFFLLPVFGAIAAFAALLVTNAF